MKKTLLYLLAAVLLLSLTVPLFSACSDEDDIENESTSSLETGALEGNDHLSPGTVQFPASTTEVTTVATTEAVTEPPVETTEKLVVTEQPTEKPTEAPTTEKETEVQTEPPASLKYYSYGNGTCAVSGMGDYKDVYVIIPEKSPSGDIVIAIDDKAFYDNTKIKAVQIPSTVMSIGDMAFGGCSSLVYISVSENNKSFTEINGVLYSRDKTRIIVFPSANPASEITISINVTEICDMAFFSTPSLKQIKYGGTLQDWSKIKIGDKNYGLYSTSMSFAVTQ